MRMRSNLGDASATGLDEGWQARRCYEQCDAKDTARDKLVLGRVPRESFSGKSAGAPIKVRLGAGNINLPLCLTLLH